MDKVNDQIPTGWEKVNLGQICTITMGQSPCGSSLGSNGIEFHQGKTMFGEMYLQNSGIKTTEPLRYAEPDSLVISVRAPVGAVNITEREICIGRGLCAIKPFRNKAITRSLYYYLFYLQNYFVENATGATFQSISSNVVSNLSLPLPSLGEQRRIVGLLARLDEAIAETQGLIEKYRNVKRGMMHDLLTCGIDARGNIRSPRTHRFKPSPLGMIPEEWEYADLGTLYDLKAGTTPNRSEVRYFDADGILWVKTLDLNEEYITDTEEKVSEYALQMNSLTIHPAGTVLLAMYGGWLQIGRTAILARPATTNQAIVALTPKRDNCIPSEFTQYFLQIYRKRWRKHAISTRKDPNISKRDIMQFAFAYPKSHDEQEAICRKIKGCSALIAEQENTAKKLAELRTGLMHDLLSGKVRIPSSDSHIDYQ